MVTVLKNTTKCPSTFPNKIPDEVTEHDQNLFFEITSDTISPERREQLLNPPNIFPYQKDVLAIHWHPEFVPIELAIERVNIMFPNRNKELIIPTQHNEIFSYKGYSGVEVDCYSQGFNQKVQLLLHFEEKKVRKTHVLRAMIEHTRNYRSSQLFQFIRSITQPNEEVLQSAAKETGANEELIQFVRIYVRKIDSLLDMYLDNLRRDMVKNKLLRNFFDALRPDYGDQLIDRVQAFLKSIKKQIKSNFSLHYFYRTSEIIEEARSHGAGIVVPHPEQFWPILLAGYDVDGYEVWNPQSQRYTDFLVSVVNRKNADRDVSKRSLLIFMGDDTHLGEKIRKPEFQDKEKAGREIGYQPIWDDLTIRKKLIKAQVNISSVIDEYRLRLST